jgi:hypothetical protein
MLFLLTIVLLFRSSTGLACNRDSDCFSVSANPNYVSCISGQCECSTLGFSGSGTVVDPCQCLEPYKVVRQQAVPYCISFDDAVTFKNQQALAAFMENVVLQIYNSTVGLEPLAIITALNNNGTHPVLEFFSENAKGRVTPVGNFDTKKSLVEYFYSATATGLSIVEQFEIKKLFAKGMFVYVEVRLAFVQFGANQTITDRYNLSEIGTFTFDENLKVSSNNLAILNLDASVPTPTTSPTFVPLTCSLILQLAHCNATNDPAGFYTSFADCVAWHTTVILPGTFDKIWIKGNTTACHFFHSLLAIEDPGEHCPHAGKTGGGVCIEHPYEDFFLQDF